MKRKQQTKMVFRIGDVLHIITQSTTSNKKIAMPKEKIVQTYHYSREQFDEAQGKTSMRDFFSKDGKVCMDCPFAVSNGAKLSACYTHKLRQYTGFLSQLRSVGKRYKSFDDIPEYTEDMHMLIADICVNRYVRFGTYGEPSLLPLELVESMTYVAMSWTGYTHQWRKRDEYAPYFMASVHSAMEQEIATLIGYRSFVVASETLSQFTSCPASEEMGFKSNCSKCGLCSGTKGKGKKSVTILEH
jgi:hypothetical protein